MGSKSEFLNAVNELFSDLGARSTPGSWMGSRPLRPHSLIMETEPLSTETVNSALMRFSLNAFAPRHAPHELIFLDDTPYSLLRAPEILAFIPWAKFIHVYRDPRDVLASYLQYTWGGSDADVSARRLAAVYGRLSQVVASIPPGSILEVGLEDYSEQPDAFDRMIEDHLALAYGGDFSPVALDRVNAGRWRRDLNRSQQHAAHRHLEEHILRLGYES